MYQTLRIHPLLLGSQPSVGPRLADVNTHSRLCREQRNGTQCDQARYVGQRRLFIRRRSVPAKQPTCRPHSSWLHQGVREHQVTHRFPDTHVKRSRERLKAHTCSEARSRIHSVRAHESTVLVLCTLSSEKYQFPLNRFKINRITLKEYGFPLVFFGLF